MKKILFLTTGGTIASTSSEEGLVPSMNSETLLQFLGDMKSSMSIDCFDLLCLDSSNIQPEEWVIMANKIYEVTKNKEVDGIVLTHGTDTMAYTASALSFMLENLPIPLILTGSQLPLSHPLSDGYDNIRLAFTAAQDASLKGVYLAFNRKIMLGSRCVKVRTMGFDAFESVNEYSIAQLDASGLIIRHDLLKQQTGPLRLHDQLCKDVFLLKLIPGMNPEILDVLEKMNYRGIVIEAFGAGGIHFIRRDLIKKLENLCAKGVSVVVCSQCLYENSDFSLYQIGQKALKQGVIQAFDMTSEACVTKLMWALGKNDNIEEVRNAFQTNYVNEITFVKEK